MTNRLGAAAGVGGRAGGGAPAASGPLRAQQPRVLRPGGRCAPQWPQGHPCAASRGASQAAKTTRAHQLFETSRARALLVPAQRAACSMHGVAGPAVRACPPSPPAGAGLTWLRARVGTQASRGAAGTLRVGFTNGVGGRLGLWMLLGARQKHFCRVGGTCTGSCCACGWGIGYPAGP